MFTLSKLLRPLRRALHHPCPLCATPFSQTGQPTCPDCMQVLPWRTAPTTQQVTPLLCAFDYAAPIKQLILAGKTGKQLDKLHLLAELTAHALKPAITELPEAILPVPLHPSRLRQRGFR